MKENGQITHDASSKKGVSKLLRLLTSSVRLAIQTPTATLLRAWLSETIKTK
jgi:hypothetical protein